MRMVDIIANKRDNKELSKEEIQFFVNGYTNGEIPDYQASALLMAVFFNDMTPDEAANLTMAMVNSGDQIDLSEIDGIKVDKHSTGGVGDTTTLVLAPLVAALDVPVAKMSGRGLGHTGGTIDKLEALKGFHVELSQDDFTKLVNENKVAVIGQSGNLTPADKLLYALRDVTGTVNSIPLIASSIMSKKIAAGADAIVLDVKVGDGAFMKTEEDAVKLAETMVRIGNDVGRRTMAIISSMEEPLGYAVGNANEVKEAIDTLKGEGPEDLTELSLTLASQMAVAGGKAKDLEEAREMLKAVIADGSALEKFKVFVNSQGGDGSLVEHPENLPAAEFHTEVVSEEEGYVEVIDAENIGVAASVLGAGRQTKEDEIDLSVGIMLKKKVGEYVNKGDVIAEIASSTKDVSDAARKIVSSYHLGSEQKQTKLIKKIITA
ncbi:Pyrimidine-nucleoside phosphorylase [Jeotgalicoccus aerolatus]|uniref:Pyrimidine-nucleoside phosphorylase n=1 Tax=Jeotgalicoccus aerolatus TaxID=709510 RepID=A0A1G9EKR7_9STAP|nr:pyrimidine-nucleoside phosphorylase [Jeotgalicoccus aerolatus]MBP1952482.1 pyrimidine-nucleoside phosphorylase [Jeotgalicoccus aerolatus]NMA80979.1 pyrimidine-nucleoside phosphorylase [Jeotgalicoccus aerolatus]CAD2072440.1 Pyrimidine-nucleoside phosphorylase [Jeotgalicoccus aerolatus]SDK76767.1 pyrimidine-nucleoside phosphorylase [Jeotgalicoccus aerolatus]GGE04676.1 pyrimidine-nucleoside phosphorylase [Jeotgalicoccus aerolatus]